ncbi:unnamed protein product [Rhizophagus irregularis]|nr:unnamed protein product [Rhizophagus irregularis]CAB5373573.1 unnamed protein product [Rhizophagus irregularis]
MIYNELGLVLGYIDRNRFYQYRIIPCRKSSILPSATSCPTSIIPASNIILFRYSRGEWKAQDLDSDEVFATVDLASSPISDIAVVPEVNAIGISGSAVMLSK